LVSDIQLVMADVGIITELGPGIGFRRKKARTCTVFPGLLSCMTGLFGTKKRSAWDVSSAC
jgi:hypothetical protein